MAAYTLVGTDVDEVAFISGVSADGTLAARSYWTWNGDTPATFGAVDHAVKFGAPTAGTGATISYSFDPASGWTAAEQHAFTSAMSLWSAEADVRFVAVASGADVDIVRGSDTNAEVAFSVHAPGAVGGATLGSPVNERLSIDTSVAGFGPLGGAFDTDGGFSWDTVEHELGHVLGLGHAGPYNEGVNSPQAYTGRDALPLSIMSYIDAGLDGWRIHEPNGTVVQGVPVTPALLDIAAAQRLYGLPETTPLSGGQVFGFNSNIGGDLGQFFDFTRNPHPIVTLWDAGTGNVLDVSGYAQGSTIDLNPTAFSSVAGLTHNVAIAYGVRIDEAVGGAGADMLQGNNDGDTLIGGAGDDTLQAGSGLNLLLGGQGDDTITSLAAATLYGGQGGDVLSGSGYLSGDAGNDVLYGNGAADTLLGGPGNDEIDVSPGGLAFGNQGADTIRVDFGAATLFGGQGDDHLSLFTGGFAFGNLGNDTIDASGGSSVYGGQGDDVISAKLVQAAYLSGDLGADTIVGSHGTDTIVGGGGADVLTGDFPNPADPYAGASLPDPATLNARGADVFVYRALSDSASTAPDRITDFTPADGDRIDLSAIGAARAAAGQAAFHWAAAFDGRAGEAVLVHATASAPASLQLDADGDRAADFVLVLNGDPAPGGWLVF